MDCFFQKWLYCVYQEMHNASVLSSQELTFLRSLCRPKFCWWMKQKMVAHNGQLAEPEPKRLWNNDMMAHIVTMSCIRTGPPVFCVTSYLFGKRVEHEANEWRLGKSFAWQNSCTRRRYWRLWSLSLPLTNVSSTISDCPCRAWTKSITR